MDYEKEYKEALERARALRNEAIEKEYAVDYIKDYETIFPELRESEDERMRKLIIKRVRSAAEMTEGLRELLLTYLEKQKEEEVYAIPVKSTLEYKLGFADGRDFEKQKEHKPGEWDDYTKMNLGRAIQIIKDARGNLYGYQTDDGIYECDKAIEALEHFLYRGLEIEKSAE